MKSNFSFLKLLLCSVIISSFAFAAHAGIVPLQDTNFYDKELTFQKFDPTGGLTLQSVDITISGEIAGSAGVENLSTSDGTVDVILDLLANLNLKKSGGTSIWTMVVKDTKSANLGTFDGKVDFAGDSGEQWVNTISGTDTVSFSLYSPGDLADFTGTGDITLLLDGVGSLSFQGSGNEAFFSSIDAGADVSVAYSYVPEPATMSIFGLGSLFFLRRRK